MRLENPAATGHHAHLPLTRAMRNQNNDTTCVFLSLPSTVFGVYVTASDGFSVRQVGLWSAEKLSVVGRRHCRDHKGLDRCYCAWSHSGR